MWYKCLKEVMLSSKFSPSVYDPGIFYKWNGNKFVLVIIYVDDIFGCGNDTDAIGSTFKYTDLGEVGLYLVIRVERDEKQIKIHQHDYITEIAEEFSKQNLKHEKYPAISGLKLDEYQSLEVSCYILYNVLDWILRLSQLN
jgi:hypothetical protein